MSSFDRRLNTYSDVISGLPRQTISLSSASTYMSIKPVLDAFVALLLLVPGAFIIALSALIVAMDGASPFYRQERIGKNGRTFGMWKLRSMVPNADAALEGYLEANPEARREWDLTQKLKDDPRITRFGRLIRKTSIDELPQLVNVVKGEMSLVGPRPMMPDQRELYPGVAYYALRPGITGFWQVSERNETSFAQRAVYDTSYFNKVSFITDLGVLLKTARVVVAGTGH